LRSEVAASRAEHDAERNDILQAVGNLLRASEARVMDRIAAFEARVDTRVDRLERDVEGLKAHIDTRIDGLEAAIARIGG
jgi:hypothetical protein